MPAEMEQGGQASTNSEFEAADPQVQLRFVEREVDGRRLRILQQAWVVTTYRIDRFGAPRAFAHRPEWRDVPLVTE